MGKLRVVLENGRPADVLDVINCSCETDRASDVWRPAFEPMRRFLERALFECDAHDHLATAVPRRDGIQKLRAPVKHTNASRSTHLVSRKRQKIAAQFLYIERYVTGTLRSVDQRHRAHSASFGAKFGDWINRAERI